MLKKVKVNCCVITYKGNVLLLKKLFILIIKVKKRLFQNTMEKNRSKKKNKPRTANHAAAISHKHSLMRDCARETHVS